MWIISFCLLVFTVFSVSGAPVKKSWTAAELRNESQKQKQWLRNQIGYSGGLMKPWTPMQVNDGSVLCWGRRYVYNNTLLPSQVDSGKQSLLAAPIHFEMLIGGKRHKVSSGKVQIRRIDDENVRVDSVSVAGGIRFRMRTDYEFDGMGRINLTMEPVSCPVVFDKLDLVFPLREEKSSLFHYIFMGEAGRPPQTNAGATPLNGFSLDEFRGLLWFGDDVTGLCWFAEGVKNWPLRNEKGIQSISMAKNGVREFRVKFGNRRFKLDRPLKLEFGIQATPTKPRDPDFRRKSDRSTLVWRWCWGDGYYYPFAEDYTAARADVEAARAKGKEVMPCSSLYFYGMFRFYANRFGKLADPGLLHRELKLWGPKWSRNTSDGRTRFKPWRTLPGGKTEWDITSPTDLAPGKWYGRVNRPEALVKLCLNSEYQDYYLYRFEEMVRKTGLKCIYLDGTIGVCLNKAHGCGYVDYSGKLRGSAPIFAMRNMMKRVRRVLYARHGESRICMHESGRISVPVLSMADTFLDGENYAAGPLKVEEFYSKLLTRERLLAEHTGIQFGFFPEFLPELTVSWRDKKAPTPASTRDMLGLMFIHDNNVSPQGTFHAKMISFMQNIRLSYFPECDQVRYYWRPDGSVSVAPKAVRHILHFGKKRGLLILFNWSDDVHHAKVKCDWSKIFRGQQLSFVTDAVTGEKLPVSDGRFTVPLAPRDFRMIDLTVKKTEK